MLEIVWMSLGIFNFLLYCIYPSVCICDVMYKRMHSICAAALYPTSTHKLDARARKTTQVFHLCVKRLKVYVRFDTQGHQLIINTIT